MERFDPLPSPWQGVKVGGVTSHYVLTLDVILSPVANISLHFLTSRTETDEVLRR